MRKKIMNAKVTVGLPSVVATVVGLVAGALQVVNAQLPLSNELHGGIAVLLVFVAGEGISPLVGPQFRNALHLPQWAATLVNSTLSAGALAVATVPMSPAVATTVAVVLTIVGALGFGAAPKQVQA